MNPKAGDMLPIDLFTLEEQARIPEFKEKWCQIALSTEPIDRAKAEAAIQQLCKVHRKKTPQIIFCDSPIQAANELLKVTEPIGTPNFFNELAKGESSNMEQFLGSKNFASAFFGTKNFIKQTNKKKKRDVLLVIFHKSKDLYWKGQKQLVRRTAKHLKETKLSTSELFSYLFRQQDLASASSANHVENNQKSSQKWYMHLGGYILRFFGKYTFTAQALGEVWDVQLNNVDLPIQLTTNIKSESVKYETVGPIKAATNGNW